MNRCLKAFIVYFMFAQILTRSKDIRNKREKSREVLNNNRGAISESCGRPSRNPTTSNVSMNKDDTVMVSHSNHITRDMKRSKRATDSPAGNNKPTLKKKTDAEKKQTKPSVLKDIMEQFLKKNAQSGFQFLYLDIDGQQLPKCTISIKVEDMVYDRKTIQSSRKVVSFTMIAQNKAYRTTFITKLRAMYEYKNSVLWQKKNALRVSEHIPLEVMLKLPDAFGFGGKMNETLFLSDTNEYGVNYQQTFQTAKQLNITEWYTKELKWTLIKKSVQINWKTDVLISGFLCGIFQNRKNNTKFLVVDFHVSEISQFSEKFKFVDNDTGIIFTVEGSFKGEDFQEDVIANEIMQLPN